MGGAVREYYLTWRRRGASVRRRDRVFRARALESRPLFGVDGATLGTGVASFIGIVIATPLNYIINNLWTFHDQDG